MAVLLCLAILAGCKKTDNTGKVEDEDGTQVEDKVTTDEELDGEQKFVFSSGSVVIGLNPILNTTGPDNGLHDIS